MQYILGILLGGYILHKLYKLLQRNQQRRREYNDQLHSKKQKEFFEGKKGNMGVSYKGKLINMDEHVRDVFNDK